MPHEKRREPLPWTRFSFDHFFDDPAVISMGDGLIGPYLRLLHAAWNACRNGWPDGHLPNDPAYLSGASRLGKRWQEASKCLALAFDVQGDWWVQKRMVREYAETRGVNAVRADSGSAGGQARAKQMLSKRQASAQANASESREVREQREEEPRVNTISSADADFARFWQEYPRKVGKAEAQKLWQKHRPTLSVVLDSLGKWKASRRWQEGFVMDGDRWVRGKRWEDEPDGDEKHNGSGTAEATVAAFLKGESNAQG